MNATFSADPEVAASCEWQTARAAIEDYWNLESERTDEDRDELVAELDCVDDSLEELRDDYGWAGYNDAITEISQLARSVGVYWPRWRDIEDIEAWEVVGPDAVAVPPKISKKGKGKKMAKKKEVERRNVWVYQPPMPLENSPIEIRVTEPGSDK